MNFGLKFIRPLYQYKNKNCIHSSIYWHRGISCLWILSGYSNHRLYHDLLLPELDYSCHLNSDSGRYPKTCSWRGWESDEWLQDYAFQVYGRSTNRSDKRNFLISSIYLLCWNEINCKEALGCKQGCISVCSIFVLTRGVVVLWLLCILLSSYWYIILHELVVF